MSHLALRQAKVYDFEMAIVNQAKEAEARGEPGIVLLPGVRDLLNAVGSGLTALIILIAPNILHSSAWRQGLGNLYKRDSCVRRRSAGSRAYCTSPCIREFLVFFSVLVAKMCLGRR